MSEEKWSSATLRVASKSRSVEEISAILKTQPSRSVEKGSKLSWSNPDSAISEESRWLLDSGLSDSEGLDAHIAALVSFIQQNISSFRKLLPDCEIDLRCAFGSGSSQGGVFLDAALLKRLTEIPMDLFIDLYPPEEQAATRQ